MTQQKQIRELLKIIQYIHNPENLIVIPKVFLDITSSLKTSALLSDLLSWTDFDNTEKWIYKTDSDIVFNMGYMSRPNEINGALSVLEHNGLVEIKQFHDETSRRSQRREKPGFLARLNLDKLVAELSDFINIPRDIANYDQEQNKKKAKPNKKVKIAKKATGTGGETLKGLKKATRSLPDAF